MTQPKNQSVSMHHSSNPFSTPRKTWVSCFDNSYDHVVTGEMFNLLATIITLRPFLNIIHIKRWGWSMFISMLWHQYTFINYCVCAGCTVTSADIKFWPVHNLFHFKVEKLSLFVWLRMCLTVNILPSAGSVMFSESESESKAFRGNKRRASTLLLS